MTKNFLVVVMGTLLVALQGVVSGQAKPAPTQPPAAPTQPAKPASPSASYTVGPEDVLKVVVFTHEDLTGSFKVDADGSIEYPFLGRVIVSRMTVQQIADSIEKQLLDKDYIRNPQVSVGVETFRSRNVFVLGEVKAPNKYPLESADTTLVEAISLAGGPTQTASNVVRVHRRKDPAAGTAMPIDPEDADTKVDEVNIDELMSGRSNRNIVLEDGDTIYVPRADRFFIMGNVKQPGSFVLTPGMTVQQAVAVAGGITERGSEGRIKISRMIKGQLKEVSAKRTDLVLPGDTIKVGNRLF